MSRRKHQSARLRDVLLPPIAATPHAAESDATSLRWARLGAATIVTWYLGGFVLLVAGALLQIGPFAWAAAWQARHWGWNGFVLSFLPGFALLALPVIVLPFTPRRPDWPFLCGAQDALTLHRDAAARLPSPERMAGILCRLVQGGLAMAVLFPLAGGVGYGLVLRIGDRGAGAPLPERTLAEIATPGAKLPEYARLVGAEPRSEIGWVHDEIDRRIHRRDFYTPLTPPGWHAGDPVAVLEENPTVVEDDPPDPSAPGPLEGAFSRGLPRWMLAELRQRGAPVTDDPVLLVRRNLGDVVPGADTIAATLCLILGIGFGVFSLVATVAWHYRRRRLLRDLAEMLR